MGKWQLTMDPVQEWGEEMEEGVVYGVTLLREPTPASLPTANVPDASSTQSCMQYRTLKARRVKAAGLERLVSELVKPDCEDPDYARIFLSSYRAFTSPSTLIQLLFRREDIITDLDNSVCVKSTLPLLVRLWLDEFWEDLRESPEHQPLRLLCVHLRHRLCFRRLARQAEALLQTFKEEDRQAGSEASSVSSAPVGDRPSGDAPTREFKEEGGFLSFSTRDIAEQLTRLDADLFVRVVPFHCLGCVWSQRDKKENRSLAPTVRATIAQFNSVTNAVITSLLSPPTSSTPDSPHVQRLPISPRLSPSPQHAATRPMHRARIIEKWISVAQECRQLRNFSSLRAILSALQSNAVYRLKNTWAAVSRESLVIFDHLCETFPDENCVLTTREFLVESGSSGEVPYLGTYLTVLTMLDTALPDTVQDGLINFEKRRREFEVLSQIRQLQTSCALYCLPSHPVIASWLNSCNTLTEQQSYDLSVKLEPPVDVCPNSPPTWSQRLISRKLCLFLNSSDSTPKKTHVDQISVSSSGSSGVEVEELSSLSSSLRPKSQSGSCVNISADSGCSSSRCSSPGSCTSCTSSQLDLCVMSSDGASSNPLSSCTSSSTSCLPQQPPCYKQGPDSYVIRVSLEIDSGNVYKSILITSQDKTSQVVQRALDKHNLEDLSCHDFSLVQILPQGKELWMPDKANVFYAMYPSDNYDFVLRQLWRNHSQAQNPCCSPAATPRGRHVK
ncbi:ral guanine nucleotide dissociation stimulator-like 1 [Electrophorus electricus]|uniref:ral guanine nucleotide dissociation stimulator-like 1 n=1 Tax=Electrophorus electricus TaxID=8005 RepID=UPI0015CFD114|nr:ral guanine nucleotide dissociation stimulator-like 1 [Electrophorus electricus]